MHDVLALPSVRGPRGALAIGAALGGVLAAAWVLERVGLSAAWEAARRATSVLPALAVLELAAWGCEALAGARLSGASRRPAILGAAAAYAAAQVLPGGRALGELLRFAHAERPVGETAPAGLAMQGLGVALVPPVLALGLFVLPSSEALTALLLAAIAWNVGLAAALLGAALGAPSLARLVSRAPTLGPPPEARSLGAAALYVVLARSLGLVQAMVLVVALGGGLDGGLGAACLQLLAASGGDAVPGQAGVLEATFGALGDVVLDDPRAAIAVPLVLRAVRLALLVPIGLVYLGLSASPSSPGGANVSSPSVPYDERAPIPRWLASSVLVLAPVILLAFEPDGTRHPILHQLRSLGAVWIYALLVVAILHLGTELVARFVDRRGDGRALLPSIGGAAISLVLVSVISIPVAPALVLVCPGLGGHETDLVVRGVLLGAVYAAVGLALGHVLRTRIAARLSAERAERAALEARLSALTARTQPHFLANALNTLAATVREDPAKAEQLAEDLGGLFGHALRGSAEASVALVDELDAAKAYLSVQAARFGDRLTFALEGDALEGDDAVPAMSVVPLVENAVLHGLSRPGSRVSITLRARRTSEGVVIEVRDDGPGPEGTLHVGHKKGLAELEQRLALAYGPRRAALALRRDGDHTEARLVLPRSAA